MAEAERIVVNTRPLIASSRARIPHIAQALPFSYMCPREVEREIEAGREAGLAEVPLDWLSVVPLREPPNPVAVAALDVGEAAVIQLALEQGIGRVCIDDKKGRRMASAGGLKPVGTLGLLLRAKKEGLIAEVKPHIDRLMEEGRWYSPAVIERILGAAGE